MFSVVSCYSVTTILNIVCIKLYCNMEQWTGQSRYPNCESCSWLEWRELVAPVHTLGLSVYSGYIHKAMMDITDWEGGERRGKRGPSCNISSSLSLSWSQHDCWLTNSLSLKGKLQVTSERSINFAMNKYYDSLSRLTSNMNFNKNSNIHINYHS